MSWQPLATIGAGALAGSFGGKSSTWSGQKEKIEKLSTLLPQQKHMLEKLLKHPERQYSDITQNPNYQSGSNYINQILSQNPEMMKQFEAPYMRQFNEQVVPGISERFSGLGAQRSSGFNQAMAQAGSGLSEQLAAMRANLGMQALAPALSYSQMPFQQQYMQGSQDLDRMRLGLGTPAFGYHVTDAQPGIGQGVSGSLLKAGGSGLMDMFSSWFGGGNKGSASPADQGSSTPKSTSIWERLFS
ncbi:MAG: hypothetical protein LLG04_18815 [Parachlamydia sp.]|nr:hypothetical protein [Parachlamydia sp.]